MAYDAGANSATNKAGPPIQFPLYVLPVAVAYNPVYARYNDPQRGVIDLTLQVNPAYITIDDNGNPIWRPPSSDARSPGPRSSWATPATPMTRRARLWSSS